MRKTTLEKTNLNEGRSGQLTRSFTVIRALAHGKGDAQRVIDIARSAGLPESTTHRILGGLIAEGIVEQCRKTRCYRLSVEFFSLGTVAREPYTHDGFIGDILESLCADLGDSTFFLVRRGFDAICMDMCEGPIPVRSYTGRIGGRIPLGTGEGGLAILAFLPEAEREEVIRANLAIRLEHFEIADDERALRDRIHLAQKLGYVTRDRGIIDAMTGVSVPILDRVGSAVAALSVGALAQRFQAGRLELVVQRLKLAADAISPSIDRYRMRIPTYDGLRWYK